MIPKLFLIIASIALSITTLRHEAPLPLFKDFKVIAQTSEVRKLSADKLFKQGIQHLGRSEFKEALQPLQQAATIYQEIGERKGEGKALGNIGVAYYYLGNYPKAIDYHNSSLKIARDIKNREGEGAALDNLGLVYYSLRNYKKAIYYHFLSLKIAREVNNLLGEGQSLNNIGNVYYDVGDYAKAIDYYKQHLDIALEIKDPLAESQALGNLGSVYYALGEFREAIFYQEKGLSLARKIPDRLGEGQSLGNLGLIYYSRRDYSKAIYYQQQALAIAREIDDRLGIGQSLNNLGIVYDAQGNSKAAINYYEQHLKIAQEIKDYSGVSAAYGNLGVAYYNLKDYAKAIDYHNQRLVIARKINDRLGEGQSLNNLGLSYYKLGNLSESAKNLYASVEVWESIRGKLGNNDKYKVSIFDEQAGTYRALQKVLIVQNKITEALEIAERGRARAFVELLASKLSDNPNEQLSAPPNIEQIKQIASAQNATLVQYSIIYDSSKTGGKLQLKESELYIWVIKPTGEVTFRKSDLKPLWQKENTELAELVTKSRFSIGARGRGIKVIPNSDNISTSEKNLKQLHELLIKPIADLLPTNENEKVIFIPQDSLFLVPFPALIDSNNKFLIQKHTILTSPAIQVLSLTQKQKQKVTLKGALVVGNPTMSPDVTKKFSLSPLPGAEKEAIEIGKMLNTQPLLTNKATKAQVLQKMPSARIIHLATHGLIDDIKNLGVPGAVVLAPDSKDNGLLTSSEILDLKLGAELIVLSACDTGVGKLTGDGVIGLSRSLITAGTPSVIVTLWKIPDDSSKILMTDFYRNLEQNPDKAVALRKAMLNTMKTYPEPGDWAAFTLIGEAQ